MSSTFSSSYAGNAELRPHPLCIHKPPNRAQLASARSELIVRKKRSNLNSVTPRTENIPPTVPQRKSSLKLRLAPKIRVSGESMRSVIEVPWQRMHDSDRHIRPMPRRRVISKHRILNRLASGFSNFSGNPVDARERYHDKGLVGRSLYGSQSYVNLGSLIDSFPIPPRASKPTAPAQADRRTMDNRLTSHEYNSFGATPHASLVPSPLAWNCRALPPREEAYDTQSDISTEDDSREGVESLLRQRQHQHQHQQHQYQREQDARRRDSPSFDSEATLRPAMRPASTAHRALAYHPRRRRAASRTTVHESWTPELRIVVDGWTGSRGLEHEPEWQAGTAQALRRVLSASGVAVSDVYFDFTRRDDGGDGAGPNNDDDDGDDGDDDDSSGRPDLDMFRSHARR